LAIFFLKKNSISHHSKLIYNAFFMIRRCLLKVLSVLFFLIGIGLANAQVPQSIPYQAVARNAAGDLLTSRSVGLRFRIHQNSATGVVEYQESQIKTTNSLGLFTANIGEGTVELGAFNLINWSTGQKFLQVELDTAGGTNYVDMGTQQLLSVPYALYSANGGLWNTNGSAIYNTNIGKVGIGMMNPEEALHIYDANSPTHIVIGGSANSGGFTALHMGVSTDMGGYSEIQSVSASGSTWGDITVNPIGGNVGIGKKLPRRKLEVAGDISMGDWLLNAPSRRIGIMDGTWQVAGLEIENTPVGGNYSQKLHFLTHHYENSFGRRVTIDEDGRMGIGTESPAARLDVAGTIKIADGTQGAAKILKSDPAGLASWGTVSGNDVLNSPALALLSCPVLTGTVTTGLFPTSVAISGNYAYVVNYSSNTMLVINISNPASPTVTGAVATGVAPFLVTASGNYAYVVNAGSSNLQVVNITNPASPTTEGAVATGSNPVSVAVSGNYAYVVSSGNNSMQVIDISNPAAPSVAGLVATGSQPYSVAVSGNYAYVANRGSNTMQVINISNPASPTVAGLVATGSQPYSVAVSGNYAYVVNISSSTMQVINITNPASPTVAATVATGGGPTSVAVSSNYAYVVNGSGHTLQAINISNPASPIVASAVATGGNSPSSVAVSGNYAYVLGLGSNTMQVFNLLCSFQDFAVTVNPITGQTTALPFQWNTIGNNISNANNGNIGIGTAAPTALLSVNGTANKPGGGSWATFSDRRLKKEIIPFSEGLSAILKIKPVSFHYNDLAGCDTAPEYVGVVAQELQEVAPWMVSTVKIKDVDYLSVDISSMMYLLVNSIKEQEEQIQAQKKIIEELKLRLDKLETTK
jgi:YVTN family beta-propeller protein